VDVTTEARGHAAARHGGVGDARVEDAARAKKAAPPCLALSVAGAAAAIGVSPDFFREHVVPEIRVVRRGRLKLVAVRELERWLEDNAERLTGADL
jgi:hypothetical protein